VTPEEFTSPALDLMDVGCRAVFLLSDGIRRRGSVCVSNFDDLGAAEPLFAFRERNGATHAVRDCVAWDVIDRDTRPGAL
jgi:hypothetical protein